jgi:hypothetical protein
MTTSAPASLHRRAAAMNSSRSRARTTGSKNPASVLLEGDVVRMRDLHLAGTPQVELARIFGVSTTVVSRIVRRLMWKHV